MGNRDQIVSEQEAMEILEQTGGRIKPGQDTKDTIIGVGVLSEQVYGDRVSTKGPDGQALAGKPVPLDIIEQE